MAKAGWQLGCLNGKGCVPKGVVFHSENAAARQEAPPLGQHSPERA